MNILSVKQGSTKSLLIRLAAIVVVAVVLMLLGLCFSPFELSNYSVFATGGAGLIGLTVAAIYWWILQPLVSARDNALMARDDAQVQMGLMSLIDPLTLLPNGRQFLLHLERMISSCSRQKVYGALLIIDLNNVKEVNEKHGHDAVLVEMAKRLRASTRFEDVLSRLVGDKLALLIDHLDVDKKLATDKALIAADKLITAVNAPFEFNGFTLQVGVCIGVSLIEFEQLGTDAIIRNANIALYRAKKSGEKRSVFSE